MVYFPQDEAADRIVRHDSMFNPLYNILKLKDSNHYTYDFRIFYSRERIHGPNHIPKKRSPHGKITQITVMKYVQFEAHSHRKFKLKNVFEIHFKVKSQPEFSSGNLLLELIDMSIFDFLIGNMDRHNYQMFE